MKSFPWKCGECSERAVRPVTIASYETELEHDGRKYRVSLADFDVARCEKCGAMVFDDVANRKLSDSLRTEVGLLLPAQIRGHRERLGLTQKELAGYLQIAEATLSRWETGAQIQQRVMDRFLRVFFQSAEARIILGVQGQKGTAAGYRLVRAKPKASGRETRRASSDPANLLPES
jgi:putative zinc finger/helix-turn-helix YgiT family protein